MNPRAPRNLLIAAMGCIIVASVLLLLHKGDDSPGLILAAMLCDVAAVAFLIAWVLVRRRLKM